MYIAKQGEEDAVNTSLSLGDLILTIGFSVVGLLVMALLVSCCCWKKSVSDKESDTDSEESRAFQEHAPSSKRASRRSEDSGLEGVERANETTPVEITTEKDRKKNNLLNKEGLEAEPGTTNGEPVSVHDRIRAFEKKKSNVVESRASGPPKPRKRKPKSKAFEDFETTGVIIGYGNVPKRRSGEEDEEQEEADEEEDHELSGDDDYPAEHYRIPGLVVGEGSRHSDTVSSPSKSLEEDDEGVHTMDSEEDEFAAVQRNTEVLKSFRRAPPPKRNKARRSLRKRPQEPTRDLFAIDGEPEPDLEPASNSDISSSPPKVQDDVQNNTADLPAKTHHTADPPPTKATHQTADPPLTKDTSHHFIKRTEQPLRNSNNLITRDNVIMRDNASPVRQTNVASALTITVNPGSDVIASSETNEMGKYRNTTYLDGGYSIQMEQDRHISKIPWQKRQGHDQKRQGHDHKQNQRPKSFHHYDHIISTNMSSSLSPPIDTADASKAKTKLNVERNHSTPPSKRLVEAADSADSQGIRRWKSEHSSLHSQPAVMDNNTGASQDEQSRGDTTSENKVYINEQVNKTPAANQDESDEEADGTILLGQHVSDLRKMKPTYSEVINQSCKGDKERQQQGYFSRDLLQPRQPEVRFRIDSEPTSV